MMTCNKLDHFERKIVSDIKYATKLNGRGDDIVITFDRLALGYKLVLCDYWLIPFEKNNGRLRRFKNWRQPIDTWKHHFVGKRLKKIDPGHYLSLEFTDNICLLANKNFVQIYNSQGNCVYESKKAK